MLFIKPVEENGIANVGACHREQKPQYIEGSSRVQQCVADAALIESSRFKNVASQAILPENNPSPVPLRIRRSTP